MPFVYNLFMEQAACPERFMHSIGTIVLDCTLDSSSSRSEALLDSSPRNSFSSAYQADICLAKRINLDRRVVSVCQGIRPCYL